MNEALVTVLCALPPAASCEVARLLAPTLDLREPWLCTIDCDKEIEPYIGAPDLVVTDGSSIIIVESKIATHGASHRYSAEQFAKYMCLGALIESNANPGWPRRASHAVLVPTASPKDFCGDWPLWQPEVLEQELRVPDSACLSLRRKAARQPIGDWIAGVADWLTSTVVRERCAIDDAAVSRVRTAASPVLVPTRVSTWSAFCEASAEACRRYRLPGHALSFSTIERMVFGQHA